MKTIRALKRGIQAAIAKHPEKFQAGGKVITCSHCGAQGFTAFELDKFLLQGLVREHFGLACASCGHIELFTKQPEAL